ncbi:MAG: hypothetical protein ACRYF3_02735 [Janthinobacterium lividum]
MNEQQNPQSRRTARLVGVGVLVGGLTLAGGSAFAANSHDRAPAVAVGVVPGSPIAPASAVAPAGAPAPVAVPALTAVPALAHVPSPADAPAEQPEVDSGALDAFFAAGYDYDDAVSLGKTWNVDSFEAKQSAGRKLLAGETLPIAAGSADPAPENVTTDTSTADAPELDAYFSAGYDYDDAVELGKIWNVDFYDAKVSAGEKLLAGETLPVQP